MAKKDKLINLSGYAKMKGVDMATIKQAIKDGVLSPAVKIYNNRKHISIPIADPLWDLHINKKDMQENGFSNASPASGYREGSQMVTGESQKLYSKARASREAFASKMAQIKYEEMIGSLVKKDDIVAAAKDIGRNLRDALLNLPNKLAPIVAAEDDIDEVNRLLTEEITSALNNLSRGDYEFLNE